MNSQKELLDVMQLKSFIAYEICMINGQPNEVLNAFVGSQSINKTISIYVILVFYIYV